MFFVDDDGSVLSGIQLFQKKPEHNFPIQGKLCPAISTSLLIEGLSFDADFYRVIIITAIRIRGGT